MIWGILLIAAGVFWLFGNFGWFSWDWWGVVWEFWPLLLILAGLGFLLQNNRQRIPILIGVAVIGGALLWGWNSRPGSAGGTETIAERLQGASRAEVNLSPGVGRMRLKAGGSNLVDGKIELMPGERLERSVRKDGDRLNVGLESKGSVRTVRFRRNQGWNLSLSPSVPIKLNVSLGVGESELDLSGLNIEGLEVSSGVGRTQVELPNKGRYRANISGGVGEIEVRVPTEIALRLKTSSGIGGVEVPQGLVSMGDGRYESQDFANAANQVDLEVSGGVGRVVVRR